MLTFCCRIANTAIASRELTRASVQNKLTHRSVDIARRTVVSATQPSRQVVRRVSLSRRMPSCTAAQADLHSDHTRREVFVAFCLWEKGQLTSVDKHVTVAHLSSLINFANTRRPMCSSCSCGQVISLRSVLTSGHSDAQRRIWHIMLYCCAHMATVGVKKG